MTTDTTTDTPNLTWPIIKNGRSTVHVDGNELIVMRIGREWHCSINYSLSGRGPFSHPHDAMVAAEQWLADRLRATIAKLEGTPR